MPKVEKEIGFLLPLDGIFLIGGKPKKEEGILIKNSHFCTKMEEGGMKNVWVFASGSGTNAEKIFMHFKGHPSVRITGLFCNNGQAGVLQKAEKSHIPTFLLPNDRLAESDNLLELLKANGVDYIILAGFLRKIPDNVIQAYSDRIINIHPALLPKFGGKGMYGMHVHRAVKEASEKETGITIHLVNEHYDEGRILFQASTQIGANDTPEDISKKVQELEHAHFARVCERFILEN